MAEHLAAIVTITAVICSAAFFFQRMATTTKSAVETLGKTLESVVATLTEIRMALEQDRMRAVERASDDRQQHQLIVTKIRDLSTRIAQIERESAR